MSSKTCRYRFAFRKLTYKTHTNRARFIAVVVDAAAAAAATLPLLCRFRTPYWILYV